MYVANLPSEISSVASSITQKFSPEKIYLFSNKRGERGKTSSFKLCVIMDFPDMAEAERQIYLGVESEVPFDIVLYKPGQWEELCERKGSFAQKVKGTGVLIYG